MLNINDAKAVQAELDAKYDAFRLLEPRERYEGSLSEFVRDAWPYVDSSEYKNCWAIEALCDHLECVTSGHIKRFLANLPPRSAKTTIASICWPAWTWARGDISFLSGPQVRFMCASYSGSLSLLNATKCQRLLLSPWYQRFWGSRYELAWDQSGKAQFDTTKGGSRIATSVRGGLLGLGGDVVLIDDPSNTETEKSIETDADRLRVENWWKEVSSTRLNDPKRSAIVVVMQRLHVRDLSGIILDDQEEDWTHLMIPMRHDERRHCVTVVLPQYDDDEPWQDPRTKEGELMWPERFGEAEVANLEHKLGRFMAAGRLQQSPLPKGGGIIDRDWWQLWDHQTAQQYHLMWSRERKEFPEFDLVVGSLDTSFGEKQENDFNALTVWGFWTDKAKNRRIMLMFAWQKKLPLHGKVITAKPGEAKVQFEERQKAEWGLIEWVADTCKRYKVKRLLIENKTRGTDVAGEINRLYAREKFGVQLINPVKDKVARAHSVVPLFTDDMVWAPETKWSDEVVTQAANFPKDSHDDLLDSCTQFLLWARDAGLAIRADEASAALEESQLYQPGKRDSVADAYGV